MRRPQLLTLLGSALLLYAGLAHQAAAELRAAAAARRPPAAWAAALSPSHELRQAALEISADSASGLDARRAAVLRAPASPYFWADYADALLAADRTSDARAAYDRAVALGPLIAPNVFRAAAFHLAQGRRERGLELAKVLLANLREFDDRLFDLFDLLGVEPGDVLAGDSPLDRTATQAYFRHLLATQNLPGLAAVWSHPTTALHFDGELLRAYAQLLLDYERPFEARRSVVDFLQTRGAPDDYGNRVFNGSFERHDQPSPLDWERRRHPCVTQEPDAGVAFAGEASLRLEFDCPSGEPFQHLVQRVVLQPGPARLSVKMKLERMHTEQGVGVWLVDPAPARQLSVETPILSGTRDWTPLEADFTVPDGVADLELRFFRRPSIDLAGRLRATVWIDAVAIRQASAAR